LVPAGWVRCIAPGIPASNATLRYIGKDRTITAVQVRETAQDFKVASTHPLFRISLPSNIGFYDVAPDGQRFLVNMRTHLEQSAPLMVITDWRARLQSK
jgi:hypothetical protein